MALFYCGTLPHSLVVRLTLLLIMLLLFAGVGWLRGLGSHERVFFFRLARARQVGNNCASACHIGHLLMALANYCLERRLLYPPVVFCTVWALDLGLVWLSGDLFFPLSDKTLTIFCGGALAFSLGSAMALLVVKPSHAHELPAPVANRFVSLLVWVLAASIPFVAYYIVEIASHFNAATLLLAARMAMLEVNETGEQSLLVGAAITLSLIVASIAFLESENHRFRATVAIFVAMVINILSGGRGGVVTLGFSLICIHILKTGRVQWKALASIFAVFLIIFGVMGVLVRKGRREGRCNFLRECSPGS